MSVASTEHLACLFQTAPLRSDALRVVLARRFSTSAPLAHKMSFTSLWSSVAQQPLARLTSSTEVTRSSARQPFTLVSSRTARAAVVWRLSSVSRAITLPSHKTGFRLLALIRIFHRHSHSSRRPLLARIYHGTFWQSPWCIRLSYHSSQDRRLFFSTQSSLGVTCRLLWPQTRPLTQTSQPWYPQRWETSCQQYSSPWSCTSYSFVGRCTI